MIFETICFLQCCKASTNYAVSKDYRRRAIIIRNNSGKIEDICEEKK
jgi:hypothetical protein